MLKICGDIICKPLALIFKQALTTGVFLSERKNDKKSDKITAQIRYFISAEKFRKAHI